MSETVPSLIETTALLRSRRSIKPADMDPERDVDRELIVTLLENASWAPTHGLTEPWRFRVYSGDARRGLASGLQTLYRETTSAAEFREDKHEKLGVNPLLAPVIIVAWVEPQVGGKIPEIEEIEAGACALQNLALSAVAAGLGSFWSSPPLIYTPQFNQWLGIGEAHRCLGLIYLGWPRGDRPSPKSARKPINEKISWADA
jgi:nitroreductase